MIRIRIVDEMFYPIFGGGEAFIREVGKRLVKKGYEITVFTSKVSGSPKTETIDGITVIRKFPRNRLAFYLSAGRMAKAEEDYDITMSTSPVSRLMCNKIMGKNKKNSGGKFVGNVFAYWGPAWKEFTNPLFAAFYNAVEDYSLKKPKFDLLVSSNRAFLEKAKRLGVNVPVEVVPSGVDVQRFGKASLDVGKNNAGGADTGGNNAGISKMVLFVGRVINIKGLEYLVGALEGTGYSLVIVGGGPLVPTIRKMAKEKGVSLTLAGRADPVPYYNSADIIVLPSIMEGCPLTILEAMAAGKPIVASNVGGIPELVTDGECGLLVEPKDVAGLNAAISSLMESPGLRAKMGDAGRKKAQEYDWDKIAEKMDKVLKRAVGD